MLPNFLVCGAQKAGTTSLYGYLRQHPDIYLPEQKELNFFNQNWDKPRTWYEDHYRGWSGQIAVGEVSPLYLWCEHAAERIAQLLPEVKLIFLLRNPIDRAYSNYWFNVARGLQSPRESFSEAIRTTTGQRRYLSKGLYFQQLARYAEVFTRGRLQVHYTEVLHVDPLRILKAIYAFLEVNEGFVADVAVRENTTRIPRNPWVTNLWSHWVEYREHLRGLVPPVLANPSRSIWKSLHKQMFTQQSPSPMVTADHSYLKEWFVEDVLLLTDFLEASPPWEDFKADEQGS